MTRIFLLFVLLPSVMQAQQDFVIHGDTLSINDTIRLVKAGSVNIGYGSKADGGYAFIYIAPKSYKEANAYLKVAKSSLIYLSAGWSGYKMKIESFSVIGGDDSGRKVYLILSNPNIKTKDFLYACDIQSAIEKKEIINPYN